MQIFIDASRAVYRGARTERARLMANDLLLLGTHLERGDTTKAWLKWDEFVKNIKLPRSKGGYDGYLPRQLRKPKIRAALTNLAHRFAPYPGQIPAFLQRTPSHLLPLPEHRKPWVTPSRSLRAPQMGYRPPSVVTSPQGYYSPRSY